MKTIIISVFAATLCLLFLVESLQAQPYAIGTTTVTYQDPDRNNRNIQVVFYYPATTAGSNQPFVMGDFPLIVFGHGFMMNYDAYELYWENLVPRGYIVALPRTEEGTGPNHGNFGQDLSFLINRIKWESANNPSSFLHNHVGPTSALMGHSMGGGASFLGAAQNNNINALINFAAAETTPSAIAAAANINIPALVFMGTNDGVTPPVDHQIPMFNALASSCKTLLKISGGGHCYFAESNTACSTGEFFTSPQPTITRAQQHSVIMAFLIPYLDFILKNNMTSKQVFQDSLNISTRITYVQNCTNYDAAMSELISPQSTCSHQNDSVTIKFQNIGGSTISTGSISYQLDNGTPVSEALSSTFYPGEIRYHTFASTVNLSAPGMYSLSASVIATNDTISSNNTLSETIYNTSVLLPQAVNFNGFTGSNLQTFFTNWQEAQGATPSGTTSSWSSSTGLGSANNVTAKINYYSSPIREWILGPAFNVTPQTILTFDAAVTDYGNFNTYPSGMGTNDKFYVKISTDCGASWFNLDSIVKTTNLPNQLTPFSYNLSAFSGQVIRVAFQAFRATSVSNDYDFHLDNILIKDYPPIDVSPEQLLSPTNGTCFSTPQTLTVAVKNLGTDTLFFSNDTMNISVNVIGSSGSQVFTNTISTGTLLSGETAQYDITQFLNMNAGGVYTFNVSVSVAVDGNLSNNNYSTTLLNPTPEVQISGDSVICLGNNVTLNAVVINSGIGADTTFINNTSAGIPDNNTNGVTSQITVSGASNSSAQDIISVKVNITHPFVSDLILKLTAPDNSQIILSNRRGGSSDNYNNVIFNMSALDSIATSAGPFSGSFIPEQPFSNLTGSANGLWKLNVSDNLSTDSGTLLGWEIKVQKDNGIVTYAWSTGSSGVQITATPLQSENYQLTVTDMQGCSSVLDYDVNVLASYTFSLGNDTSVCQGQSVTFDAGSFNTVVWHNQSTSQYFTTDIAGTIYAQVTNNCGVFNDTVNVNVWPLPVVSLGDTISVCTNTPYTINAGSGFINYLWSTQQTSQEITVSSAIAAQQSFIVTVTDVNGCTGSDDVLIIFTVCSSISPSSEQILWVYPNPAYESITIDINSDKAFNVVIYNHGGQIVKEMNVVSGQKIDISNLSSGNYIITIGDGHSFNATYKLIKQ